MDGINFTSILKDWVIPIGSILLSAWFAMAAKRDSDKSELMLKQVHAAISGWQTQMMESLRGIMDSNPQVIEGKVRLNKVEAAKVLIESMKVSIEHSAANPQPGAAGHTQVEQLKEIGNQLSKILDSMK